MDFVRFCALRKGSKKRKDFADLLRKRGNFLSKVGNEVRRPFIGQLMKNAFSLISPTAKDYLPCKYCYGLYKKTYLWCHEKVSKN